MTSSAERGDRRTFATAAAADFTLHPLLGALAFRAREFGADQTTLGLVFAAGDALYMAGCLLLGGLSERFGRRRVVIVCAAAFAGSGLFAASAASIGGLVFALALQRIAASVFWPTLQGRLADQSVDLARDAGKFNLSWSTGKACGYAMNGVLFGLFDLPTSAAFVASALCAASIAATMPKDRAVRATRPDGNRVDPVEAATASRRIVVALLGNFAGCAAFTVIMNQAPALMEARGYSKTRGSILTACFVVSQIAAFAISMRRARAIGTPRALLTATALTLAGLVAFCLSAELPALILACSCAGFGAGLAYAQAMVTALRLPAAATRGAGRHEAVIGAANAATAPTSGVAADVIGRADGALYAAVGIVVGVIGTQAAKLFFERRRTLEAAGASRSPALLRSRGP